ncbi:unnamed protein product [Urochloa humidicola]
MAAGTCAGPQSHAGNGLRGRASAAVVNEFGRGVLVATGQPILTAAPAHRRFRNGSWDGCLRQVTMDARTAGIDGAAILAQRPCQPPFSRSRRLILHGIFQEATSPFSLPRYWLHRDTKMP